MPVAIGIIYLKNGREESYPDKVTVDVEDWVEVTTEMVEEQILLRFAHLNIHPKDLVEFSYLPLE